MALRDHNKQKLEVWLKLYVGQFPKTGGMINLQALGKPTSSVPVMDWLTKRWLDPEVRETDFQLSRLLNGLRAEHFEMWEKLWIAHLSDAPNTQILDRWRKRETPLDRLMWGLYCLAINWILDQLDEWEFRLVVKVRPEDQPVTSTHEAKMNDYRQRKKDEHREIYDYFTELDEEIGRMERYERTAKRFSVHCDTVRAAVRFYESEESEKRQRTGAA